MLGFERVAFSVLKQHVAVSDHANAPDSQRCFEAKRSHSLVVPVAQCSQGMPKSLVSFTCWFPDSLFDRIWMQVLGLICVNVE